MTKPFDEQPLTAKQLSLWATMIIAAVSFTVSIVWFLAGIWGDNRELRARIEVVAREASTRVDTMTISQTAETRSIRDYIQQRREIMEKRMGDVEQKQAATDRSLMEVSRKLDVAVAILERLDKRAGTP